MACRAVGTIPTITLIPSPTTTPIPSPTLTPPPTPTPNPSPSPSPTSLPISDARLVRGPYLQSVTPNSVIVVWETDVPGSGEVAYGETDLYSARATDGTIGARHAVTLTGLSPYTVYHYRVEMDGALLAGGGDFTFRTAAGPGQTAFTFAVLGDTRTQHEVHRGVVERIVAMSPDFVLHTGDLVEVGSDPHQWEVFFEIERELIARAPLFPTLGNHEGDHANYFEAFYLPGNERWYVFDYGPARFVCLQVDGFAEFGPGSQQYAWLEDVLADSSQDWLVVYFHAPPYTSVEDGYEEIVRQVLPPLFERYGVDLVFNGHKHNYERNEVRGVTYVVTGGGGAPLYAEQEREPTQAAFALAYHFVLVEVNGGWLGVTAISDGGEVLDRFELRME